MMFSVFVTGKFATESSGHLFLFRNKLCSLSEIN